MDEKFNELISRLQEIGYEPDNEDLIDLDMYEGSGYVSFYGPDRISVALKFEDFELDLNGQGHMLTFFKKFTVNAPSQAVIKGAEREFHIELDLIALPNRFFEVMTHAIEVLSKVEVK
jgi:hypothetical protein